MSQIPYDQMLAAHQSLFPGADLSKPETQEAFNKLWGQAEALPDGAFDAIAKIWQEKPDQKVAFIKSGGDLPGWLDSFKGWWAANGKAQVNNLAQFPLELGLLDKLDLVVNPAIATTNQIDPNNPNATPFEQVFGQDIINYGERGMAGDAAREAEAQKIKDETNLAITAQLEKNKLVLMGGFDAVGYMKMNPDVAAQAAKDVEMGRYPDLATAAEAHYNAYGKAEGRYAPQMTRLQDEFRVSDNATQTTKDAAQLAATSKLAELDQRKTEMTGALDQLQVQRTAAVAARETERVAALDKETAQLREGLGVLETERKTALAPLLGARIDAAEGQVTGINQALQSERDAIIAKTAQQGFIGGSTMEDSALARASMGARQNAAIAMGGAKVANAGDTRALGDDIANQRFGITGGDATQRYGITNDAATSRAGVSDDTAKGRFNLTDALSNAKLGVGNSLADQIQGATNTGTAMKTAYYDNDWVRQNQATQGNITLNASRMPLINQAFLAGQSGKNQLLQDLITMYPVPGAPAAAVNGPATQAPLTGANTAAIGGAATNLGGTLLINKLKGTGTGTGTGGGGTSFGGDVSTIVQAK